MKASKFIPSLFPSQAFPCAITLSLLAAIPVAQAADSSWDGDTSTAWADAANWSAGIPGTSETATFNSTYTNLPTLLGNTPIGRLVFGSNNTNPITLTTGTGNNRMNIGSVSSTGIQMDSGTAAVNIGLSTAGTQGACITASQNWTNNSSSLLTVNRVSVDDTSAAGTYTLTINGSGIGGVALGFLGDINNLTDATRLLGLVINSTGGATTLSSNNTYTGGTVLTQGNLRVGAGGALGLSAVALNGGKLSAEGTTSRTLVNAITMGNDVALGDATDTGKLTFSTTVDLGGANRTLTTASNVEISGVASNGGITKLGGGVMTLSGINTYAGATAVNGGKLTINGTGSINNTSGVSIGAGEFNYNSSTSLTQGVSFSGTGGTLSGTGTFNLTVDATAGNTLAPGNGPGTMTFGNTVALNGTALMEINGTVGAGVVGGHDFVNLTGSGVNGVLTYGGTMTLDMGVLFGVGSYSFDLFNFASESSTFATITLSDQYSGSLLDSDSDGVWDLTAATETWQFTESTGVLNLNVIPEPGAALLGGLGMLALLRRRRCA